MGKLWDWHKKMFNTPILAVSYRREGSSKNCKINFMGSRFESWENQPTEEMIEIKPLKVIDVEESEENEFDIFKKYKQKLLR